MGYLVREKKATDSTRKAPARLHRALDRVMDARSRIKDREPGTPSGWGEGYRTEDAVEQFSVQGQKSNGQMVRSYFNSKQEAEKEARELERLGHKNVKVTPAKDSVRKAPARLHRALDAVLDARPARAKDSSSAFFKPGDKVYINRTGKEGVIVAVLAEPRGDNEYHVNVGGRMLTLPETALEEKSTRGAKVKDRVPADCFDLGVLPVRAKDLNTTPPRDALASQAKARAWLESLQERMQPAYAAEDKARERYKNASSDQRYRYDLEKKWDIASAKVAQLEKEWDQAHAAVKRAIPGFEW
jgi:hypothetical protein